MNKPLVTIVCLSYNHADFILAALNSIWNLNYPNIQLIMADDASIDNSQQVIKSLVDGREVELILNKENLGHCKTFNKALQLANGKYIIDLAADDVLLPNSVGIGVAALEEKGDDYAVFFADSESINNQGEIIANHLTRSFFKEGRVPQGDVYKQVLGKYFISPVTMIYRKSLVDDLGGYDESLAYEDFDFWVRSSRIFKYCYRPEITVQRRVLPQSASTKQYIKNSEMLKSTLVICKKALNLNRTKLEDLALLKRIGYEGKMSLISNNYLLGFWFFILALKVLFKVR